MNNYQRNAEAFRQLLASTPDQLAQYDIAEMNLLCAHDLPGTEHLDIHHYLSILNEWTDRVRTETDRRFPYYLRNPNPNKGSEAVFRLWSVIFYLKECYDLKHCLLPQKNTGVFGVCNEAAFGPEPDWSDASLHFIYGLMDRDRMGSCASLPVLFVAIARRLGYPVKLVSAVQHMFIRWESPEESFNMEGTGPDSISIESYENYIDEPRKWDKYELACGCYLRPLTPIDELAAFMLMRAGVLRLNGRLKEAHEACEVACSLSPKHPAYARELILIEERIIDADYEFRKQCAKNSAPTTRALSGGSTLNLS